MSVICGAEFKRETWCFSRGRVGGEEEVDDELGEGGFDAFVGRAVFDRVFFLGIGGGGLPLHPLHEGRIPLENLVIDRRGLRSQQGTPFFGDLVGTATGASHEAGMDHIPCCPSGAIDDEALAPSRKHFDFFGIGEAESLRDQVGTFRRLEWPVLAQHRKQGKHKFLIRRDSHGGKGEFLAGCRAICEQRDSSSECERRVGYFR